MIQDFLLTSDFCLMVFASICHVNLS